MAKATAECTCKECGATFTKSVTKNNRKEANSWEAWAVDNYTQCGSCWAKEMRKIEEETPLTLDISCDPCTQTVLLSFSGNTMPAKDDIKALGGYYFDYVAENGILGALSTSVPKKGWQKQVDLDEVDAEINKTKALSPIVKNHIKKIDVVMLLKFKKEKEKKAEEREELIKNIEKPKVPEKLKGKSWNKKVYGKSGTYCFYGDGEKTTLSDDEAREFEKYVEDKEKYEKAIADIDKELNKR